MIKGCAYEIDGVAVKIELVEAGWFVMVVSAGFARATTFQTFGQALCNSQVMVDSMRAQRRAA